VRKFEDGFFADCGLHGDQTIRLSLYSSALQWRSQEFDLGRFN